MKSHKKCCTFPQQPKRGKLLRVLSLFQVTVCGVGIILGAGIYALIGAAAGMTGNSVWLAFFISSLIAAMTGLCYAELSSIFKKDAGEYEYAHAAFDKKIAMVVSFMVLLTGVFSAATVAIGFGGYLMSLVSWLPVIVGALGLILLCAWVDHAGIKDSAIFNTICTAIEALGLVIIVWLGLKHLGSVNYLEMPNGISGVLKATALVFFAYMGFETIVKLSEETKNPEKTIPKSIIYSLIISTVLYILVAISAVSILNWQKLAASHAPLADVAAVSFGMIAFIAVGIIALFSTSNTVLMTLVTTSRMIYGLAEDKAFPRIFAKVSMKRHTPTAAIIISTVITAALLAIKNIETLAYLNNLFLFGTFGMINLSVLFLRYKRPSLRRPFKVPLNIGKMPVLAVGGVLSCAIMIIFVLGGLV